MGNKSNLDTPSTPTIQAQYSKGLTKREYACIHLGVPKSGDPELDKLILESNVSNRNLILASQN